MAEVFPRRLTSPSGSITKLTKSEERRYRIIALALAHARNSSKNMCPEHTTGCEGGCVGGTGLASVWREQIMGARIAKTQFFIRNPVDFVRQFNKEIEDEQGRAEDAGEILVVRPNAFSDQDWFTKWRIPQSHPKVIFYDYSKVMKRHFMAIPENYHICFSWSELDRHKDACRAILKSGGNVAVPFAQRTPAGKSDGFFVGNRALLQRIPAFHTLDGIGTEHIVEDGDITDLRFLDPRQTIEGHGRIIALRLKSSNIKQRNAAMKTGFCQLID